MKKKKSKINPKLKFDFNVPSEEELEELGDFSLSEKSLKQKKDSSIEVIDLKRKKNERRRDKKHSRLF